MSLLGGNNEGNDDGGGDPGENNPKQGGGPTDPQNPKSEGNWMEELGIDETLRKEAAFADLPDVNALAKGYLNAQKMVGKEKFVVPREDATDIEWRDTFRKLGLPESAADYKLEVEGRTDEDIAEFTRIAHAHGILPKQASAFLNEMEEYENGRDDQFWEERSAAVEESIEELEDEWGQAFQSRLARAQRVIRDIGGEDAVRYMNDTGLGDDANLARLMDKVGAIIYAEDNLPPGTPPGTAMMTPSEATERMNAIQADLKNPYYDAQHPGHSHAVKEFQKLMAISMGLKPNQ